MKISHAKNIWNWDNLAHEIFTSRNEVKSSKLDIVPDMCILHHFRILWPAEYSLNPPLVLKRE